MNCPQCNGLQNKVYDSRHKENNLIWRRRECLDCGCRWTTIEVSLKYSEYIEGLETCIGCYWCGRRHQKCSCCRRNPVLKDCYTEG